MQLAILAAAQVFLQSVSGSAGQLDQWFRRTGLCGYQKGKIVIPIAIHIAIPIASLCHSPLPSHESTRSIVSQLMVKCRSMVCQLCFICWSIMVQSFVKHGSIVCKICVKFDKLYVNCLSNVVQTLVNYLSTVCQVCFNCVSSVGQS